MSNQHIYLLSGPVQGGKTTLITEKIAQFKQRGVRVMGFLCPGEFSEGKRTAFSLEDIETGEQVPMGSTIEKKGWVKYRRFYFNPEAFDQGARWIREGVKRDTDLIVVDEVGPMELEGGGWAEILDMLKNKKEIWQLWTVRESLVGDVGRKWGIPEDQHFSIEKFEALNMKWI